MEVERVRKEKINAEMKKIYKSIDKEDKMKLNRDDLMTYFKQLHKQMGDQFKGAGEVSEECYDDVIHEMDFSRSGYISWHQVKPFIARIEVHEK